MVRIIKDNTIHFQAICEHCGSEIQYDESDIYPYSIGDNATAYMIGCQACGRKTVVS